MKRIGLLSASSIDNAGDVLVGYAARQALRAALPGCEVQAFAPVLPHAFWGHEFSRARGLDGDITPVPPSGPLDWADGLDALVVGGGGLILSEAGFAPFLLGDPARWDGRVPAAWNGLCSQNTPSHLAGLAPHYAAVRACCERLRYVSVRNATTERFLRRCGYAGPIHVVPDPALLLDVPADPRELHLAALAACGIDPARRRPLIGVSVGGAVTDPHAAGFFAELLPAIDAAARELGADVVLFPFGQVYGDAAYQLRAAAAIPSARVLRTPLDALGLWRLIGHLDVYVCTRLHAMLAAFAQDVPFLVLDEYLSDEIASSKIREFVVDGGLEPLYLCPSLSRHPAAKLRALLHGRADVSFASGVALLRERLQAHYRDMIAALGLTDS